MTFEIDWLTLEPKPPEESDSQPEELTNQPGEPKNQPDLAWRPVLLVHGWFGSPGDMVGGGVVDGAWGRRLSARDIGFHAPALDQFGTIGDNAAALTAVVADLKDRFGVERVNVVGYCKGGLDARQYAERNDDVGRLIMQATPNAGSFAVDTLPIPGTFIGGGDPKKVTRSLQELTGRRMQYYNRHHGKNPRTEYYTTSVNHISAVANFWLTVVGPNDEWVSIDSVDALPFKSSGGLGFETSSTDPQDQACASARANAHLCLLTYDDIVDHLFRFVGALTPPPSSPGSAGGQASPAREEVAGGTADPESAAAVQGLTSDTAPIPADGVTQAHTVLVDAVDTVLFYVFVDGNLLRLELVSPAGRRIDAATPAADPAVVHGPLLNAGPFFSTCYIIQAPETGNWTLEVTGTGAPPPDTVYAVAALAQLPPGTGVALAAAADREQYVAGGPVTITATVTADGVPVTGATVTARVTDPDGDTTTDLVLAGDGTGGAAAAGDGAYSGVFAATTLPGFYDIAVSAEGAAPAFTREQRLEVSVAPSATTFSGTVSDHGVDTDGDGRFDQLVVDVGVEVDVVGAYRVFGTLTDGAGTAIEQLRVEQQLQPGPQTVSLAFDGALLFALGRDGPYLLDDLVLEDVATSADLAVGPAYTTAAYARTDFQRPPLLLTGNASDHGAHFPHMERMPYEELVIAVEVDTSASVDVEATANLRAEDGSLIAVGHALSSLASGLAQLEFHFTAHSIFRTGKPGPFTLQLLSIWGTAADGTEVSLLSPDVVAVTQAYPLEDFAESPRFTVGGTVTGLVGHGLELELVTEGPPGTPPATPLRVGSGPFTFTFPTLVSGNPYEIRVKTAPANPIQACTVNNASGTIEDVNVTNVEVICV